MKSAKTFTLFRLMRSFDEIPHFPFASAFAAPFPPQAWKARGYGGQVAQGAFGGSE